jgi:hypothetical protein
VALGPRIPDITSIQNGANDSDEARFSRPVAAGSLEALEILKSKRCANYGARRDRKGIGCFADTVGQLSSVFVANTGGPRIADEFPTRAGLFRLQTATTTGLGKHRPRTCNWR